jgi:cytochrome P450
MISEPAATDPQTPSPHGKRPPGPRGSLLLGNMREQARDRLRFQMGIHQRYGDIVRWRVAHVTLYQVTHPDHLQHVLHDNHRNYTKGTLFRGLLSPMIGNGLFVSEGDFWLRQRRLMQPAFHRKYIAAFGQSMVEQTQTMLQHWAARPRPDQPLDIAEEMMALTLNIVTRALFGADVSADTGVVYDAFSTTSEHLIHRFDVPWYPPEAIPTPRNRRFVASRQALDAIVFRLIDEHTAHGEDTGDLLSLLIHARDEETGATMNRMQLRDEVMTLLLAGHETTANALTWGWYLVSQHPDVERRLHSELRAVLGGRAPGAEDLPNLPYTRMVVEESLRMYPPVWATHRQAIADDEIGGYHIPAGTILDLVAYVTHHRPDVWENPEVFDPERFSPERSKGRSRYAFNPFSAGPRQCIGLGFAMTEAQIVLATVAQRYRLELPAGQQVVPFPQLTLRPRDGLPMLLHPA